MVLIVAPLIILCTALLPASGDNFSTMHWGYRETRDTSCSLTPPNIPGLEVQVVADVLTFPPNMSLASNGEAFAYNNGDISILVRFGANTSKMVRSSDGGRSWTQQLQQLPPYSGRASSEVRTYAAQLEGSGEVLLFSGFSNPPSRNAPNHGQGFPRQSDGSIIAELLYSSDHGKTQKSMEPRIFLPPLLKLSNLQHTPIVQVSGGDLLALAYAHWQGVDGFTVSYDYAPKDRVFMMRSADNGKNWYYLSTVAFDPTNNTRRCQFSTDGPHSACSIIEGFNEPWLTYIPPRELANGNAGTLVALLRTGGSEAIENGDPSKPYIVGPLYRSISVDGGLTWGLPQAISDRGVSPTAAMTRSGVLVAAYGRPNNWLMFSLDHGASWFGNWCYMDAGHGRYDGSEYDSVVAVPGADEVLVTYGSCTGPMTCEARALIVRVKAASGTSAALHQMWL